LTGERHTDTGGWSLEIEETTNQKKTKKKYPTATGEEDEDVAVWLIMWRLARGRMRGWNEKKRDKERRRRQP
jgi:hypothetical protein